MKPIVPAIKFLFITILIVLTVFTSSGQTAEILSNKSVIELHKAGLSTETVVSKIETSQSKFDVTTAGLIALKKQGIPDAVITAMVNKGGAKSNAPGANPAQNSQPVQTKLNIDLLNYIYTYYNDTIKPLEKSLAASESKRVMMGYGGNDLLLLIDGTTSPVKLSEINAWSFIINMGSNNLPDLVIYKLRIEKGKRKATVGKLAISGPKSGDKAISVEISKLSDGIYILKPGQNLEKGEYFFANKPNLNTSTSSVEVYAFSVI